MGAVDYVTKPFDPAELRAALGSVMAPVVRARSSPVPSVLTPVIVLHRRRSSHQSTANRLNDR